MTPKQIFIAGDWGTSNLRLYLCQYLHSKTSKVLDIRFGPGIKQIDSAFEEKFFNLTQEWFDKYGALPVLLSGMVGSTNGWKETPYGSCPTNFSQIVNSRLSFVARGIEFSILAVLKTKNPLGNPDVMRGEELQILGWMQLNDYDQTHRLFALPGTHTKWATTKDGKINEFLTAFTGELFGLLRHGSTLITDNNTVDFNQNAFFSGVRSMEQLDDVNLIHTLFATRSKQVLGEIPSSDGWSYLAGLIVTADIMGAIKIFGKPQSTTLIGESKLTEQYALVLNYLGISAELCDPAEIAVAGFDALYKSLYIESAEV
ncbi:MAG: 2-dehydro-3-deoxygalactonokinase [Arenicella sp.]|nr:2-dehydro-3-deoxygalactonokinase [Arenicella sp.]